eukprot:8267740-Ditylum_brightwellii.AAC.1
MDMPTSSGFSQTSSGRGATPAGPRPMRTEDGSRMEDTKKSPSPSRENIAPWDRASKGDGPGPNVAPARP